MVTVAQADLQGKLDDIGPLHFVRVEWWKEAPRFALLRIAIEGKFQGVGSVELVGRASACRRHRRLPCECGLNRDGRFDPLEDALGHSYVLVTGGANSIVRTLPARG